LIPKVQVYVITKRQREREKRKYNLHIKEQYNEIVINYYK